MAPLATLFLLLLAALSANQGSRPGLAEQVAEAGVVVLGTVSSAAPDGARAVIKIEEYHKRGLPQSSLQVAPACAPDGPAGCAARQARYETGERVLLFLRQGSAGWTPVGEAAGKYTVRDDRVIAVDGADVGSLDEVRARLAQLTGRPGAPAPGTDPTPEVVDGTAGGADLLPLLYLAAILAGVAGLGLMAVLARSARS